MNTRMYALPLHIQGKRPTKSTPVFFQGYRGRIGNLKSPGFLWEGLLNWNVRPDITRTARSERMSSGWPQKVSGQTIRNAVGYSRFMDDRKIKVLKPPSQPNSGIWLWHQQLLSQKTVMCSPSMYGQKYFKCPNYHYALLLGGIMRAFRLLQSLAGISNCTVSTFLILLHQKFGITRVHVNEEWEWTLWKPQDRYRCQFTFEVIHSILYSHKSVHKKGVWVPISAKRCSVCCAYSSMNCH